jgi:hypothetical protein
MAEAILDIFECARGYPRDAMLLGFGDILSSFHRVLLAVGGQESVFFRNMHLRMAQLELDTGSWPYLTPSALVDSYINSIQRPVQNAGSVICDEPEDIGDVDPGYSAL